jgi:hypothetical protein
MGVCRAPLWQTSASISPLNLCPIVPARGFRWEGGVCRRRLRWHGGHCPPPAWALWDIRVVSLGRVAIVPVDGRGQGWRRGFDIDPWGWRDDDGWVGIRLPVWPPVPPEGHDEAGADEEARPARPMPVSVPMASKAVAFEPMPTLKTVAPKSMPAAVGVPRNRADPEQHRQDDNRPHPRPLRSHGPLLSLRHIRACFLVAYPPSPGVTSTEPCRGV